MNLAPFIYALGWSLLHSLWQGALLAGTAYVLVSVFYLSAKEKVDLLFSFLCLLLVGFIGTYVSYLPDFTETPAADNFPMKEGVDLLALVNVEKGFRPEPYFPYLAVVYILGVGFHFVRLMGGYKNIARLKSAVRLAVPDSWDTIFSRLKDEMGIGKAIGFYLSEKVEIPTVIGYFKPVILFPVAALSALDIKQVETILVHELTHIRRNDYLLNILKCLMEAILFFNPFVRVLCRMLEKEREHTCDDEVLNRGGDAMVYAYALLSLESIRTKSSSALVLGAFNDKEHLLERIKRITLMKKATLHVKHKVAAFALLMAGLVGLAWISPSSDSIPKPPKAPEPQVSTLPEPPVPVAPDTSVSVPVPPVPLAPSDPAKKDDTVKKEVQKQAFFSSKEWQDYQRALRSHADSARQHAAAIGKFFNSSEWKGNQEDLKKNNAEIVKQSQAMKEFFDSPAWKESVEELAAKASELGRLAAKDHAYFDSPAWKAKEKEMQESSKKMEQLSEQLKLKLNSPEMLAKQKALEAKAAALAQQMAVLSFKTIESPEFKAKQEALEKKAEELKRRGERLDVIIKQLGRPVSSDRSQ
ncbi:M56 family metallopeptidase [Olivibacter sp. XZL3]|uniref:M56 family metallopeptidase n=1 Tax=Olivibacter sp. XZL3 TaxID=1735116 RepID=UPI001065E2E8|nr:M56 family metallopeptidase [Olivibacter sp. XZL3]